MRRRAVQGAVVLAGALVAASLASGLLDDPGIRSEHDPASVSANATAHEHDHSNASSPASDAAHGPQLSSIQPRHEHPLAPRDGSVPTRAEASEFEHQFEDFTVEGDGGLVEMAERGYLDGSGTLEDPYVIDRFRVTDDLTIKDTSKALVVENSYIEGQLTLNYVGEDVYVHHTYVYDLRVNENVERDGPTTAGLFEQNKIAFIGQLRHFGGTFAHNTIGPRPDGVVDRYLSDTGPADLPDDVVWNFDGYHLGHVHNNTVDGRVDAKLHGHFHGSCSDCPAHDHADPAGFPDGNDADPGHAPRSAHSYRFHTLDFENNTIRTPHTQVALRFYDEAHDGDDQTAASEPNAYLEDRHEHHQFVRVAHNDVRHGSLVFDIIVAEDPRHGGQTKEALVHLVANNVTMDKPRGDAGLRAAYVVHAGDAIDLVARENRFAFHGGDSSVPAGYRWMVEGEPGEATGFLLHEVGQSRVLVAGTIGQGADYGVTLDEVADDTPVRLEDNRFRANKEDRHNG